MPQDPAPDQPLAELEQVLAAEHPDDLGRQLAAAALAHRGPGSRPAPPGQDAAPARSGG